MKRSMWMTVLLALVLATFGGGLLRPLPKDLPPHRIGGVLGLLNLPEVGPVWVELGAARADQTRPLLRVQVLHPGLTDSGIPAEGGTLTIGRVRGSDDRSELVSMEWDGRAFQCTFADGSGHAVRLAPRWVADLRISESRSGFLAFGRGCEVNWTSHRPDWWDPSPLDEAYDQHAARLEQQSWTEFFDTMRWMVGNRPGLNVFGDTSDQNIWPCERWRVTYHRSAKALSVLTVCYRNMGGVHGNTHFFPANLMDGPMGVEWLEFASLFRQPWGWQDEVRRWLMQDLRRQGATWIPDDGTIPASIFGEPRLDLSDQRLARLCFSLSPDGVFVHFEPYEAGTYAEGTYVVLLPWRRLMPWIRPEILEAIEVQPALPDLRLPPLGPTSDPGHAVVDGLKGPTVLKGLGTRWRRPGPGPTGPGDQGYPSAARTASSRAAARALGMDPG